MENYEWATSCKPSLSMMHPVECARKENPLGVYYIRTGALSSTQGDQRFYDLGLFQVATVGIPTGTSGNTIGELWCTYEIELKKPRIQVGSPSTGAGAMDHIPMLAAGAATVDTSILPATPFGTSQTVVHKPAIGSTLGGIAAAGTTTATNVVPVLDGNGNPTGVLGAAQANTYYWPPGISTGNYMIQYLAAYSTPGTSWTPTPAYTNCKTLDLIAQDGANAEANVAATTSLCTMLTLFVTITKANASISFPGTTEDYATPTYADLYVLELPAGIDGIKIPSSTPVITNIIPADNYDLGSGSIATVTAALLVGSALGNPTTINVSNSPNPIGNGAGFAMYSGPYGAIYYFDESITSGYYIFILSVEFSTTGAQEFGIIMGAINNCTIVSQYSPTSAGDNERFESIMALIHVTGGSAAFDFYSDDTMSTCVGWSMSMTQTSLTGFD